MRASDRGAVSWSDRQIRELQLPVIAQSEGTGWPLEKRITFRCRAGQPDAQFVLLLDPSRIELPLQFPSHAIFSRDPRSVLLLPRIVILDRQASFAIVR